MFKKIYFITFALSLIVMAILSTKQNHLIKRQNAIKGVIDLSRYDLAKDVVSLDGYWQFLQDDFFEPGLSEKVFRDILVPGGWKASESSQGLKYATYRLKIILPLSEKREGYSIYFNRVSSAYKLFVNGHEIGGNGAVGKTELTEIPKRQTRIFHFDVNKSQPVDILVHVSNHVHISGGIKTGVLFARSEKLKDLTFKFSAIDLLSSCILLTVAIIYLSIFSFNSDKQFLFFFLFLFFIALYVAGTGENLIGTIFPWLPWFIFMKGIHIFMILHLLFYNHLLNTMYFQERITLIFKGLQVLSIAYLLVVIFFSAKIYITFLPVYHLVMVGTLVYWIVLLTKASINEKAEALLVLVGVVFYGLTVVAEILYVNNLAHNPRLVPFGLLMLVFSYIVVTTKAYAESSILVEIAEKEKYQAIEQANFQKAELVAEQERSTNFHKTLTDSESSGQIDKIRENLRQIGYIVSESGGCKAYDDQGAFLFDSDLTLKKITEIFGVNNQLIRCSKAYVVNPSKARKVFRNGRRFELQFLNTTVANIPVGNKYVPDVRDSIQLN